MAKISASLRAGALWCLVVFLATSPLATAQDRGPGRSQRVTVLKTPEGGIQPQAVTDTQGTIHLVYFRGDPAAGDLYYMTRRPGETAFSTPVRVNSQPGSAIAIGTIRGGQFALGRGGRIHVAWNGSGNAQPKNPLGGSPMLYARSDERGTAFEPQRNLMTRTSGLDGGGTIAADGEGRVYVAWHGRARDAAPGESGRRLWVTRSKDDGASFEPEAPALEKQTGACACCGTRALADSRGRLYILYRAATKNVERDMVLLTSADQGERFRDVDLHPWRINACPMSSESLVETGSGVLASWETQGEVYYCKVDPKAGETSAPIAPPGGHGGRKHPSLAANAAGQTILVWDEGTGWQKGGALAWQVFDRSGKPTGEKGRIERGVPVWGMPAVVARPDGGFLIIR